MSDRITATATTVIVTAYNHASYVEQCLESVAAQADAAGQVIVVDDHSTDATATIVRTWIDRHDAPFTFLARPVNGGVCAALNEALESATGDFFCHVSADDWITRDRIGRQSRALAAADEDVAFIVGDMHEVDAGGVTLAQHDIGERLRGLIGAENREALLLGLLERNLVPAPAVMLRTDAVRGAGGYDESLVFEDYDMWLRLARRFGATYSPGTVSHYRVLNTSLTRTPERAREFADSVRRSLTKHRDHSPRAAEIIDRRLAEFDAQLALDESSSRGRRRSSSATRST